MSEVGGETDDDDDEGGDDGEELDALDDGEDLDDFDTFDDLEEDGSDLDEQDDLDEFDDLAEDSDLDPDGDLVEQDTLGEQEQQELDALVPELDEANTLQQEQESMQQALETQETQIQMLETEMYQTQEYQTPEQMTKAQQELSVAKAKAETLEQSRQQVQAQHEKAVAQILAEHGDKIPQSQLERIANGANLQVVMGDGQSNVLGSHFFDGKTNIEVVVYQEAQARNTTQHETNHMMSYNTFTQQQSKESMSVQKNSGVRQFSYENKNGEISRSDKNRALNEGITSHYTNQQLEAQQEGLGLSAARQNGYQQATEVVTQMEQIVGKDAVAHAYYTGDVASLQTQVDALGGKGAFETLSRCTDTVTYERNPEARAEAMAQAQEVLCNMSEAKEAKAND